MSETKNILAAEIIKALEQYGAEFNEKVVTQGIISVLQKYNVTTNYKTEQNDTTQMIQYFISARQIDGLSTQSLKAYRARLSLFNRFISKPVGKITIDDLRAYISYLTNERQLSRCTLATDINILKSFFGWLHTEDITKSNPCLKIKSPKVDKKGLRKALSIEELEKVRNACVSIRDKAIIELLYSTGCRLSEVIGINIDDINFLERSITVLGKGNKRRTVYFSVKAKLLIAQYLESSRRNDNALFTGVNAPYKRVGGRRMQMIVQNIGRRAGINKSLHPHLLRHTFASNAVNAGMDIIFIQQLLGHEDVGTTQIYAEISQNNVRQAYYRLSVL